MRVSSASVCVAAWILAGITQVVFMLGLRTDTIIAFGVDISHASHMLLLKQGVYIALGIALALAAYANARWRPALVIVAALFYLMHWFPWRLIGRYGFIATAKSMYVLGSTEGLRFMSLFRDVVLPITFAVVIVMAIGEKRSGLARS